MRRNKTRENVTPRGEGKGSDIFIILIIIIPVMEKTERSEREREGQASKCRISMHAGTPCPRVTSTRRCCFEQHLDGDGDIRREIGRAHV